MKQENIETITTSDPVTLLMKSGEVYREKRMVEQDGEVIVMAKDDSPVNLDLAAVDLINAEPWRLGEGYKWFGQVNLALESERGNSDSDEVDLDFESIWRSLEKAFA